MYVKMGLEVGYDLDKIKSGGCMGLGWHTECVSWSKSGLWDIDLANSKCWIGMEGPGGSLEIDRDTCRILESAGALHLKPSLGLGG